MNKKDRLSTIWTYTTMFLCSAFIIVACSKDELDTDIFKSEQVTLIAYGPNPALRGQNMTFVGTNLNKISKVILPNDIEITEIEVVNDKLIKVIVPQATVEGLVKLIGPKDLELVGKDSLFISEPIEITSMSPQPVKAGQELTIEGNYFNLMTKVIFTDKVEVLKKDCKSWDRTKIVVVLPKEAAPGIVTLENDDEIPLEYQSPETLDVVLPSVNTVLDLTGKKPGEAVSAPGKNLDLVVKVEMPNGEEVDFTITDSTLKFTLPQSISDGSIVMIPASNVRVVVANIGVAIPEEVVVTPNKGLRAGDEITIKGKNLELVTTVSFPGVDEGVKPTSQSATEIKLNMPDMAISGKISLNLASGKKVEADIETLKPVVNSYDPSPAQAGMDLKLLGQNLDLVVSVTFANNLVVPVVSKSNELTVEVPLNAVTGVVVLTMANTETVECAELEIVEPPFAYLPNPPGPRDEIFAGGVLSVIVGNGDKLTDVQINSESVNFIVDVNNLYIMIPRNAKGNTELKLISGINSAVYTIPVIAMGIVETTVWEGLLELSWDAYAIPKANFGDPKSGARLRFYYSSTGSDTKLKLYYGDWEGPIEIDDPNFDPGEGLLVIPEGVGYYDIVLTSEMIYGIQNPAWGADGMLIMGDGGILSRISLVEGNEPEVTVIWTGEFDPGGWGNWLDLDPSDFEAARVGKIWIFTIDTDMSAGWAMIDIQNDDYAQYAAVNANAAGIQDLEIEINQDILNNMLAGPTHISGANLIIKKISIK